MAGKSKLQLSRLLDERITRILSSPEECPSVVQLNQAYILGSNCGNTSNYVGLTTNYDNHDSGLSVVGLCYLKSLPGSEEIKSTLEEVQKHYNKAIGNFSKIDKNEGNFLIYNKDQDSNQILRRIFNISQGEFLTEQPLLSVLEESKIYMHSSLTKVEINLNLPICQDEGKLRSQEKIDESIDTVREQLGNGLEIHLLKSSYSNKIPSEDKNILETLYSSLDVPKEVEQMGDYLPQMSKEEKKKIMSKWRNKMKDQRSPLTFRLEQENLTVDDETEPQSQCYHLKLECYLHLQVNDTISKCAKRIIHLLRQQLNLLKLALKSQRQPDDSIEKDEIKSCSFKPSGIGHIIQTIYMIASPSKTRFEQLKEARKQLHETYLLPLTEPSVRFSQRLENVDLKNIDELNGYLCNVHKELASKSNVKGASLHQLVRDTYTYHHYMQDRASDSGWGCAYRSLQTIISWFKHQAYIYSADVEMLRGSKLAQAGDAKGGELRRRLECERRVPTHEEIQQVLVDVGDKQASFVGSNKWIGSQEVCFVLDHLFNIESKFISVSSGAELAYKARELGAHFEGQGTPVMIGGGVLAHTIIGLDFNEKNGDIGYLILDPHYTGAEDLGLIQKKGWCGWKKNSFWDKSAFYNLCLPQRPIEF